MNKIKKQILQLLEENTTNETSSTGTTGERIIYAPYNEIVDEIYDNHIKDLEYFKDTTLGLFATDKEPTKIFELIMNTIDGNQCMSAEDYEYYKNIFDTELNKIMFQIK